MLGRIWALIKDTITGYMADQCLSRGAAIAYYTIFSIAPLLIIATAIAGFFFGDEAVRGQLYGQLRGMLGPEAAENIQTMVQGASSQSSGIIATVIGTVTLLLTASGTFGELQSALNAIWKTGTPTGEDDSTLKTVSRLVKAKAAAIGLVAATGFLLLVSLVVSAVLSALASWVGDMFPGTQVLLWVLNTVVSVLMITALFAAIYKVLPDRHMTWGDVLIGALVTAILFTIGKTAIGWYLGSGAVGTSFGAASALVIVLLWIYYSSQIFLVGAEFTRAYAGLEGSHQDAPVPAKAEDMGRQTVVAGPMPMLPARREPMPARAPVWPVVAAVAIGLLAQGGWRRRHRA